MTIEKTADNLLEKAIHLSATDIHITPRKNDYIIQFRLHSLLETIKIIPPKAGERLISHLKFMASMDISEKRKPQSGSLQAYFNGNLTALRISSLPTALSKESLAIRILPQNKGLAIEQMTMFPSNALILFSLIKQSHGMIIFTGPTGSGKSSTMYTLAEYCAKHLKRRVVTLEDPVEIQNDHFVQVQLNEKAGITYKTGLKAILRHDPDVIIIGEIRDDETAKLAIRAALTGHLVMASLHARDAKGAFYRLLEFGINQQEIEQSLLAITAQRLLTLICPICGGHCSKFCMRKNHPKRTSVYEILYGQALEMVLEESNGKEVIYRYPTLKALIRKGFALGYVSNEEYRRWIFEEENSHP